MRLFALRGAIDVEHNDAGAIHRATSELMREILERNALATEDVVSCLFTVTHDLDADFPAARVNETRMLGRRSRALAEMRRAGETR